MGGYAATTIRITGDRSYVEISLSTSPSRSLASVNEFLLWCHSRVELYRSWQRSDEGTTLRNRRLLNPWVGRPVMECNKIISLNVRAAPKFEAAIDNWLAVHNQNRMSQATTASTSTTPSTSTSGQHLRSGTRKLPTRGRIRVVPWRPYCTRGGVASLANEMEPYSF